MWDTSKIRGILIQKKGERGKYMHVHKKTALALLPIATAVLLGGCSLVQWNKPVVDSRQSNKITTTKTKITSKNQNIKIEEKDSSAQESKTAAVAAPAGSRSYSGDSLLPPAKPGECYARILIPAKYETHTEKILKKAPSERIEVIPAKYDWVEEKVKVEDASYDLVPVAGDFTTKTTKYQTSEGRRFWAVSLKPGAAEANTKLLEAAKQSGIDLDGAKVGTCYHEHYIPPKYRTEKQQVIDTEAYEKVEIIPAKYEWEEKKILVTEPSYKLVKIPETYKTITEKILVEPAKTVWKKGRGPVEKLDNSTGEIMCLVEVPAKYKTITKTVVDKPATTKRIEIPAEYKTVKVKKLVSPAKEKRIKVPATYKTITKKILESDGRLVWHESHDKSLSPQSETGHVICLRETPPTYATYTTKVLKKTPTIKKIPLEPKYKTVKVRKLVSPAKTKRVKIPAEYQTVTKRIKVSDEHMEWVPILCETNFNVGLITQLQKKLKAAGFDPGKIDGQYGKSTYEAVTKFQKKNGLASGHLTMETLRALGVAYQ